MSMGGRALPPPPKRQRHPLSVHPLTPGRPTEKAPTPRKPAPFLLRTPGQAPCRMVCPINRGGGVLRPPMEHSPNQRRARRQPDEHGRQGLAPAAETAKASVVRASSYPRSSHREAPTPRKPEPFCLRTHLVKAPIPPQDHPQEKYQHRANPLPFASEPTWSSLYPTPRPPTRETPTPRKPAPFCFRTHLVKPLSHPRPPTRETPTPRKPAPFPREPPGQKPYSTPRPPQEREKLRPHAPLRGPGPHRRHQMSGRVRSVPGRVAFGR